MALVKFGAGVSAISGKVGGVVYAHNSGGSYVRNFKVPVNPQSDRQIAVRSVLAGLAVNWSQVLTPAQRTAWELYAASVPVTNRLGESIFLSGINMYIRSNSIMLQCGGVRVDDGPVIFSNAESDPTMTPTISEATQQISLVFDDGLPWASEDNAFMAVYMTQPTGGSVRPAFAVYNFAAAIAGDLAIPITSPQVIAVPYVVTEGQQVFVQARIIRADGRITGSPFRAVATIVA